jgi:hypothetical protein
MTIDEQIIHANHKLGRDEAVLDCMNAIEAEQELLYQAMDARRQEMRSERVNGYDIDKDLVVVKLRAQIDVLYVMHKTISKL